jgi:twitching motility two-component system response regulator PilG
MSERRDFVVRMLGVPERELRVLKTTLLLSQGRVRSYRCDEQSRGARPDILIVDGEAGGGLASLRSLDPSGAAPVVFLGGGDAHWKASVVVPRPLVPTKVLAALDDVTRRFLKFAPELVVGAEASLEEVSLHSTAPGAEAHRRSRHAALVVDDSVTVRAQLQVLLQNAGVSVDAAETGEQALHYLAQNHYDIVFLDVVLPGADGYQLCKTIKKNKQLRETPVVMLTSKSSPFDRVRGSLAGCDTYLTKPVDLETFRAVLAKHLQQVVHTLPRTSGAHPAGAT